MGYFNRSVDNSIKRDASGRTIYYPWTYWGEGRVIEDPATEAVLRNFVSAYNISWVLIIIGSMFFSDPDRQTALLLGAVPVMLMFFHFITRRILRGCPVSEEALTFKEYHTAVIKNLSEGALLLILICCVAVSGLSGWAFLYTKSLSDKAICILGLILFGLGAAQTVYQLKLKDEITK